MYYTGKWNENYILPITFDTWRRTKIEWRSHINDVKKIPSPKRFLMHIRLKSVRKRAFFVVIFSIRSHSCGWWIRFILDYSCFLQARNISLSSAVLSASSCTSNKWTEMFFIVSNCMRAHKTQQSSIDFMRHSADLEKD